MFYLLLIIFFLVVFCRQKIDLLIKLFKKYPSNKKIFHLVFLGIFIFSFTSFIILVYSLRYFAIKELEANSSVIVQKNDWILYYYKNEKVIFTNTTCNRKVIKNSYFYTKGYTKSEFSYPVFMVIFFWNNKKHQTLPLWLTAFRTCAFEIKLQNIFFDFIRVGQTFKTEVLEKNLWETRLSFPKK